MNNPIRHIKRVTLKDIKSLLALILIVPALTLSACSQESSQNDVSVSGDTLSAPLPSALLAVDETNLVLGVVVDGGVPQPCANLSVDQGNGTYTCNITLSGGPHTISLVFSIIDATYGTVRVATASDINVDVVPGQTASANFSTATLAYDDGDGDGIRNLDELDEGSNPNELSYYVGGTVTGLLGSGTIIQNNGGSNLVLSSDDSFYFIPAVADNNGYAVTVSTQPSSPNQTCIVTNGSGSVSGANVTDVVITCETDDLKAAPNLVGLSVTQARQDIVAAGFVVGNESAEFSTTVIINEVISQDPVAGTLLKFNSSVNLVISLGPPPDTKSPSAENISPPNNSVIRNTAMIMINFSESMNKNSLVLGGTMAAVSGDTTWSMTNIDDDTLTIRAFDFWSYDQNSTLTIDAEDLAGNALTRLSLRYSVKQDNIVFVTSMTGSGNLATWTDAGGKTGLAAADAVCQARASAANLPGSFKAWMSNTAHDAYCRVHNLNGKKASNCGLTTLPITAGPWLRTNGTPFSEKIDKLIEDLAVFTPLWFDEFGNEILASERYFTGTRADGTVVAPNTLGDHICNEWVSGDAAEYGLSGITDGSGSWWSGGQAVDCSGLHRLACFQTGPGPELPNFQTPSKKVFLTTVSGNGNLGSWPDAGSSTGIAAGDAICRARAAAGGLVNASRFKAWLSDSVTRAADRITSNGPWTRIDGTPVALSKADLLDGRLLAAIFQSELGTYISNFSLSVHTGTTDSGDSAAFNCADWTDGTANSEENYGSRNSVGGNWSDYMTFNCSRTDFRLFCFED